MWTNFPILVLLVTLASCQDMVTTGPPHETGDATPPLEKTQIKPVIRSLRITSNIKYRYSTTLVSTRVVNPSNQPGEATFTVTLPESAFISEFLMEVKDKVYKAYVKEKEEAKAIYQDAVQAGQFAGHVALDARDSNQFTVSVNIEAHGKVTFNLTYEQLLSRNLGVYSNVININPQQVVEDMKVIVDIEEPSAIVDLEVPELQLSNEAIPEKHNEYAKIEDKGPNHKQVIWAPTSDEQKSKNITGLSGQFIVRYDVDREGNSQQILVDEGYFVHFFAPENLPKLKKHVIFVLDFSGSMGGRKLEQLKEAMKQIFSDLEPKDYFSIVIFQSWVEVWSPAGMHITSQPEHISHWQSEQFEAQNKNGTLDSKYVVQATPANIELARTFMEHYSDLGSTNIMGGLRTALKIVDIGEEQWTNESDPPHPVLVFLTDGQPNVEEYDTNVIITKTTALNTKQIPIFSLAFGYGADFNFLRKLSLQNFGFARNIYEAADATQQLKNFYQTIASPLLSDVTFHYLPGQVDNSSNTKQEFPVFFSGSELVVAGRVNKNNIADGNTIGELRGTTATGPQTFPIIIRHVIVKPQNRTIGHLEKAWSYLTIQQLLDKSDSLDSGEEKNQTRKKALDLALQYAFVTPLTSLVVVKPNETESAVDATKVKPGSDFIPIPLSGGSYGPVPASAGGFGAAAYGLSPLPVSNYMPMSLSTTYPGSIGPYLRHSAMGKTSAQGQSRHHMHSSGRVASRFPAPSQPPPPPRYSSDDDINGGQLYDLRSSPDLDSFATHGDSGGGLVMVKVKVPLEDVKWLQKVLNATSTIKSVTVEGNNYKLGINETNSSFGNCNVNNESGECHHLQYCVLSDFQDDISQFLPFKCHIPGDYLGVCCPKYLV